MIRINLLTQRRAKGRMTAAESGTRALVFGVFGLILAGIAVGVFVDRPKRRQLAELARVNGELTRDIAAKNRQLTGYAELKKAAEEADERYKSIRRLLGARIAPAHVLHELGEILTASKYPTMTDDMIKRTGNGLGGDPNKRFQPDWDPSHVWLSAFTDTGGSFKLEGGAQTENDMTQLAKRLAVSVFFADVTPSGGERVFDGQGGSSYFRFTITGKVVY
ncbi:MAG TPA: PilN domain-containing protein [Kofleriaceae bacterium]